MFGRMLDGTRTRLLLALVLLPAVTTAVAAGGGRETKVSPAETEPIRIEEPWARAVINPGGNTGAYMRIHNATTETDRLVDARAVGVRMVELHTHEMDGDMARMRQVPEIALPAGETVVLAPRGLHVMLMGVESALREGDTLDLTLIFETTGEIAVPVPVRSITGH